MAQNVEAKGGKGGNVWDDGADHDNVTKINVRGGPEGIQYVQFDYVKSGQFKTGSVHGLSGRGFTQTFEIISNNEYLVSVEGYYDDSTGVIQALKFITNMKTSEMMGYDDKGIKFSLEVKGKKIIGFHGSAETNLNSLGAYFTKAPPTKLDYQGGSGGSLWDDGPNYNGVKKVSFTLGNGEIRQIKLDYDNGGLVETREHGENQGQQVEFVVDYPTEYIIALEGTCDIVSNPTQNRVRSLTIKTSKGRTSPIFGKVAAHEFVLESNSNALIGFHGRAAGALDAIGAYFSIPSPPPAKLDYQGGSGGTFWDDGYNHDGVRKVAFTLGNGEIRQIRIDYHKNGSVERREHGENQGRQEEFVVDYPTEYIIAVEGTCDIVSNPTQNRVRSLTIKTSNGRTSPIFGNVAASKFVLQSNGSPLIGFHGRAAGALDAIGAYFSGLTPPPPAEKLQAKGGEGGDPWNDGVFDAVRKIYVGQGENGITAVKFVYDKDSQVVEGDDHGKTTLLGYEEFNLEYPSEYITAVEGCYDKVYGSEGGAITMLKFKTNQRTSPSFGIESASSFIIEKKGYKIVGFHGNTSHELHQLGVYVLPITQ
ncbi:unnamed protein product [Thlaspi arvense]|uniref:Jacalin-type lectin domain-containing protein n=1 Tax=Thlaspi arvense TaxID=13288 RepID=A0AAU9S8H2_THLAR|nr:unnamed protein product [Thlaspi arvense]